MLTGGSVISGASGNRYKIEWYLSEGTTATTYQAVDEIDHQPVIVKVLNASGDHRVMEAFWREGEVLEELAHSEATVADGLHNVPRVLDKQLAGSQQFMVLELLSGLPLETMMERQPFLPEAEALVVAEQVLRVMALLHHLPRTLLSLRAKDIWLQRRADGTIHHVNMVDWKHVSPLISPPLPREAEIKDLTQMARMFFWMVTGQKLETSPLPEDELAEKAGPRWPAVTPGTRQLLIQALSPDPSQRYRTAAQFRRAIQNRQGAQPQGTFYQFVGQVREPAPTSQQTPPVIEPPTDETPVPYPTVRSESRPTPPEVVEGQSPFTPLRMQGASSVDQEALRAAATPKSPIEEKPEKEVMVTRRYSAEEREVIGFRYEPTIVSLREELSDALAEVQREHEQAMQTLRRRQNEEMTAARTEYEQKVGGLKGELGSAVETAQREYEEAVLALRRQQAEKLAETEREHGAAVEQLHRQQAEALAAMQQEHEAAMEALRQQQAEALTTAQAQQRQQEQALAALPTSLHDDVLLTLDHLSALLAELEYKGLDKQLAAMRSEIEERLKELEPISGKEEPIPNWLEPSAGAEAAEGPSPEPTTSAPVQEESPPAEAAPPPAAEAEPMEEPAPPPTPAQLEDIRVEMEGLLWDTFPEITKLSPEAVSTVNARFARGRELVSYVPDPVFQAKLDRATRLMTYLTKRQDAAMMGHLKLYPDFHDFIDTAPEGGESALVWVQVHSVVDWMERARQDFAQAKTAMDEGDQVRAADLLACAYALSRMVEHTIVYLWQQYLPEESYSLDELNAFQAEVQRTGRKSRGR